MYKYFPLLLFPNASLYVWRFSLWYNAIATGGIAIFNFAMCCITAISNSRCIVLESSSIVFIAVSKSNYPFLMVLQKKHHEITRGCLL